MSNEFVTREEAHALLKKLREKPENKECVDCSAKNPTWATILHGAYICFQCAGTHRGMGTHISFVRSTTLDNWKRSELRMMEAGGNQRFKDWISSHGLSSLPVVERYKSSALELYRETLRGEVSAQQQPQQTSPLSTSSQQQQQTTEKKEKEKEKQQNPPTPAKTPEEQAIEDSTNANATVVGSKKAAAVAPPRGRLGAKKVDTDSFFADFDAPESTPEQESVSAVVESSSSSRATAASRPQKSSSLYSYNDPSLLAETTPNEQIPFGMTKPKQQPPQQTSTPQRGGGGQQLSSQQQQHQTSSPNTGSGDSDVAQRRFANAKAISSDQFFGEERAANEVRDPEKEARLSRFSGARAISSADYFERDESAMRSSGGDTAAHLASVASADLGQIRDTIVEKGKQLAGAAQQWFNEMQQS